MQILQEFRSPNFDHRPAGASIDFIILHYTDMETNAALQKLCDKDAKVSCHYFIGHDGVVLQLVDDKMRSWHAGVSYFKGASGLNDCSIGIEIDNLGFGPFTEVQMESCVSLCKSLVEKYNINPRNVIGHSDIAPARKLDPGLYFDWERLGCAGLGIVAGVVEYSCTNHCHHSEVGDDRTIDAKKIINLQKRLASLGYQIESTGLLDAQTNAVIRAFQAHFCQKTLLAKGIDFYRNMSSQYSWDDESEGVLKNLLE